MIILYPIKHFICHNYSSNRPKVDCDILSICRLLNLIKIHSITDSFITLQDHLTKKTNTCILFIILLSDYLLQYNATETLQMAYAGFYCNVIVF